MALSGTLQVPNGGVVSYHKIIKVEILCSTWETRPRVVVWVGMFASQELRDAGGDPLWTEYVEKPLVDFESDPRALAYAMLKDDPRFGVMGDVIDPEPTPAAAEPAAVVAEEIPPLPPPPEPAPEPALEPEPQA